ncbi:MAG: AEC family transporter [Erysipelotrichaceae bacterium]|nr:AEC family transporter [Erysipelotrichaceae bacterium]
MTLILLKQITILFLMMLLGMILVKTGLLAADDSRILSILCIYILLPCSILKSFQIDLTEEVKTGFLVAIMAAIIINILLIVLTKLIAKPLHLNAIEKASISYANAANLIIPLVTYVLGEEWVVYASAFICVQVFFLWTHAESLISGEKHISIKKIITNINLIVAMIGICMFATGIRLPSLLTDFVGQVASVLGPIAMIMIGMILASVKWKDVFSRKSVYIVTFLKMIVMPLIILLCIKVSGVPYMITNGKTILYISFLAVISPTAAMVTQLAQLHDQAPDYASTINVMTTITSIVTMPIMTAIYMAII